MEEYQQSGGEGMTKYIIDGEELHKLVYGWDCDRHPILLKVYSHPYNPQAEREYTMHFLEAKLKQMRNLDYTDMYPVNECLINWIRGLQEGKDGEP